MPLVYRPWISPYGDDEFEWDRRKSLALSTIETSFSRPPALYSAGPCCAGKISVGAGARPSPRFMGLGELYGRVLAIIYTPRRRKCRIISLRPANLAES